MILLKGYIRCNLASFDFGSSVSVAKRQVFRLQNGTAVFYALLHNGVTLVVTAEPFKMYSSMRKQKITIYDMPALVSYRRTCALLFRLFRSDMTGSIFEVAVVADGKESLLGHLKVAVDGMISFDNEPVSFVGTKVLLSKCILRG